MIFGYEKGNDDQQAPMELREVTFSSLSPDDLDLIAKFLSGYAAGVRDGTLRSGGHRHLQQSVKGWAKRHGFDVIVTHP